MKLPKSYYNLISFVGTVIAGMSLFMIILFSVVGYIYEDTSSYLGLFVFIILPIFLILGLLIIPLGMIIEVKKRKKRLPEAAKMGWPVIDLNINRYRNAILIFSIGTIVLFFLSAIGSYEAFHYTESTEFCGTLCHEVMEPEYVAYQNSPHARVACVECHVGTGAGWYVRSKLAGLRQVYAVITDDFSRPIATPIHDLRPARETCEKCHWPEKFYAQQLRQTKHFLTDSVNTEWNINLKMKIGPQHSALGLSEGIHWHINPDIKIEYIPKRDNRRDIPWVKYTNLKTGEEIIYVDEDNALSEEKMAEAEIREMDCMDCHNRPSHHYYTPQEFIDHALISGDIPKDLPFIKKIAMDLFVDPYESKEEAFAEIESYTRTFYTDNYPEIAQSRGGDIDKAIAGMKFEFSRNIFPNMKVSWDEYDSHIGHKTYNGCFRCHNDNHQSADGQVIRKDCNICHTIVLQGKEGEELFSSINASMDFVHPKELEDGWQAELCTECHRYLY